MPSRIAFLIGNQVFRPDSGSLPLEGPANDIAALADLLGNPQRGNFEVHEFLDKTHNEILPDLEQALGGATLGDLFLIYYSGHGKLARNGHLCLVTADTREDALRSTSIPTRHLRDLVEESHCDQVVLILDCCYSGAVDDGLRGDVGSELHVVDDAHGFYIMTASTAIQAARETAPLRSGAVMGRFTAALVEGIESGAADQGRKGKIFLSDLRHYLRQMVIGSTPQFFDRRATGDPLICLSPAAAAPLLDTGVLGDIASLNAPDNRLRSRAAEILLSRVKSRDAHTLAQIRSRADYAVPALAAVLNDADSLVSSCAAFVLMHIGSAAVPALVAILKDPDHHVRVRLSALHALAGIGQDAVAAVPALIAILKDPDHDISSRAAHTIGQIAHSYHYRAPPDALAEAVPALITILKDPHHDVRVRATSALNWILYCDLPVPALTASLAGLTPALNDFDHDVRSSAKSVREKILDLLKSKLTTEEYSKLLTPSKASPPK
jgi:HEAT repeat protein